MTRREIEAVLDPHRCGYQHVGRAIETTIRHGWIVKPDTFERARADLGLGAIYTGPIVSDEAMVILHHEGGHLEDPNRRDERDSVAYDAVDGIRYSVRFASELYAWQFALHSLRYIWNATMQKQMEIGLWSYRQSWKHVQVQTNRDAMQALIAAGHERAKHLVYLNLSFDKATQTYERAAALIARL